MNKRSFTEELSSRQILEIDACTRCGECLKHCPVQDVTGKPSVSPPEKIRMFREFLRATDGLKARLFGPREVDRKLLEDFTKAVYRMHDLRRLRPELPGRHLPDQDHGHHGAGERVDLASKQEPRELRSHGASPPGSNQCPGFKFSRLIRACGKSAPVFIRGYKTFLVVR